MDRGSTSQKPAVMRQDCLLKSNFLRRWFAAVEALSPQDSANILTRTSAAAFVGCMRSVLPPEESQAITDAELHALHDAMCSRLEVKSGQAAGSFETMAPAGNA